MFATSLHTPSAYDPAQRAGGLIPLWPHEAADYSIAGHRLVLAKLVRACAANEARARVGHWTYTQSFHADLVLARDRARQDLADALAAEHREAA